MIPIRATLFTLVMLSMQGCSTYEFSALELSDEPTVGELHQAIQESPDMELLGHIDGRSNTIFVDEPVRGRLAKILGTQDTGNRWVVPQGLTAVEFQVRPLADLNVTRLLGVWDGVPVSYPTGKCTTAPPGKCLNQGDRSLELFWELDVCTIKPAGNGCLGSYNLHPVVLYDERGCQGTGREMWWPVPSCIK